MKTFEDLKKRIVENKIYKDYQKMKNHHHITTFDDDFYARFNGMYFNGLPVYYYLQDRFSMGRCYDTSAILALAIGEKASICRGELSNVSLLKGEDFGHGWVQAGNNVYDTTWKLVMPIENYYNLFRVKGLSMTKSPMFVRKHKEFSDWKIHSKEYYEDNYVPFVYGNIFQAREFELSVLSNPNSTEEQKVFARKVLADLPDIEKVYQQYSLAKDSINWKDALELICGNDDNIK